MTEKRGTDKGKSRFGSGPWLLILIVVCFSLYWMFNREQPIVLLDYGEFIEVLEASKEDPSIIVQNVKVGETDIRGEIITYDRISTGEKGEPDARHKTEIKFRTQRIGLQNDLKLHDLLKETVGPGYKGDDEESPLRGVYSMFIFLLFILVLGVGLLFVVRWMSGGSSPFSFGRSRAKLYAQDDTSATFQDVAGIEEAVAELREVVDFLKNPQKYQVLGGRIPKGVLLIGPPGTGKTLLARAVAGEAEVPFYSMSGSDFVEMFVGVGAARVRDVFTQAEGRAPCIIFIDELDALGKTRTGAAVGGHDEREQTLNQLLVEMDGFDANRGLIIMAATNRPETLDPALLRPGRFDRTVVVDRPDINGREAILKVHIRDVKLGENVDLRRIAALTPGSVGADLENIVNESALMAARKGKETVDMAEFDEAVERCAVGLERRSRIMNAEEKQRVAYHEAGHALVACSLPNTHPVHKISIIPRGVGALGYVLSRPDEDRYLVTQSELESNIKVALAGTLAEEMIYDEVSNGATNDLQTASQMARDMVKHYGMSPLGRLSFDDRNTSPFLQGAALGDMEQKTYSEQTSREIDVEVRKIIDDATNSVRSILLAQRETLEAIAKRLMEKEVMEGADLRELIETHSKTPRLVPDTTPKEDRKSPPIESDSEKGEAAGGESPNG